MIGAKSKKPSKGSEKEKQVSDYKSEHAKMKTHRKEQKAVGCGGCAIRKFLASAWHEA